MSINLSDLTSPNNQDSLAEITSGADFLDPIGKLKNLSRAANAGGHALQTTALNQPRALPLIKNPAGKLGGYLYIPDVAGNYATGPSVTIGANQTWEAEVDMVITQISNYIKPFGGGVWTSGFGLAIRDNGGAYVWSKTIIGDSSNLGITLGTPFNIKYGFDGTQIFVEKDGTRQNLITPSSQVATTSVLQLNQQTLDHSGNYAIQKAKLTVNSSVVFDCDFNGSTSIRHGDTKFQAAVGGPVSLTKAGNDPITVVKKSVLRFANQSDFSTNIALQGLLNQTITGGYMFAAFSVLGDGGESTARVFGITKTGDTAGNFRAVFSLRNNSVPNDLYSYAGQWILGHSQMFDDDNGNILHESLIKNGTQKSLVNNAGVLNHSNATSISSDEFNIVSNATGVNNNAALDLEFLALFSADSVPDEATATKIRDYINKRNQIYLRHQTDGFYFFDPQKLAAGDVTSWNGNITGSDLGDTDVATNVTIVQGSQTSQPNADGYSLTFEDNTQHLEWASAYTPNFPAGQTKAWQIVGTSLGTFAYLTQGSVTELNLLGNAGGSRSIGDLYGIILLPASATGKDIEDARKLLIDRGGADGATSNSFYTYWSNRLDIVEFNHINTSSVTSMSNAWFNCQALSKFPLIDTSNVTSFNYTFYNTNLESFPAIQAPLCTEFTNTWQSCSALTSFPSGAKLGTSAQNVNFSNAWRESGLTSFSTPLPTGNNLIQAWYNCTSLESFSAEITAGNLSFAWYNNTALSEFKTTDIKSCSNFSNAWQYCSSLSSFPSDALLGTSANNVNFSGAWWGSGLTSFNTPMPTAGNCFAAFYQCTALETFDVSLSTATNLSHAWGNCSSLTDFSANVFDDWNPSSINNFSNAWVGCTSLTAQSVENILTSIDASGKYATTNGASGGPALADAGIDIDYNVATGSLSAATNTAIDSLSGKGWEVFINGVLVIPNILDLQPAAAYSLRSFDSAADPVVVNVRRSSDSASSNFKASEVSDGTLTDWVNAVNPQVMDNPDITSASNWTLQSSTTYNSSTEAFDLASEVGLTVRQSKAVAGQTYQVTLVIPTMTSGGVKVYAGGTQSDPVTSAGTHVVTITAGSSNAFIALNPYGSTTASIASFHALQTTADGHVTTWYDQGGTNHAAQATASSQPKIVDGGTLVTEGGLAALDFDGADDYLAKIATFTINGDHLMTAVHTPLQGYLFSIGYNDDQSVLFWGDSGNYSRYWLNSSVDQVNSGEVVAGQRLTLGEMSSGSQTLYIDGTQNSTKSTTYGGGDVQDITIGYAVERAQGANYLNGKLQELIFFNADQSTNRTGIETNINDTYTIY